MNSFPNILFLIMLLISLVLAGVFCSRGMEMMDAHCSSDTNSVWCSDLISHGTIMSNVVMATIFSMISLVAVFFVVKTVFNLVFKVEKNIFCYSKLRDKIPILSPIQVAFSKGIIHPKIP